MAASRIQFGRHLECAVCTETYSPQEHIPKMLPCGHTFCNICLENVASDKSIECPKCKASHKISRQGVQGISTNHDILGILFYFIGYVLSALIPSTQCILGFALNNVHNNNSKHIIFGSYILGMVDYSCEECLRYGQTSRCTHCKNMLCSSCRESHKGDLQKSVIDIPDMDLAGLSITTGETASASVVSTAVMAQWLGCWTRKLKVVSSLGIGSLNHNQIIEYRT